MTSHMVQVEVEGGGGMEGGPAAPHHRSYGTIFGVVLGAAGHTEGESLERLRKNGLLTEVFRLREAFCRCSDTAGFTSASRRRRLNAPAKRHNGLQKV